MSMSEASAAFMADEGSDAGEAPAVEAPEVAEAPAPAAEAAPEPAEAPVVPAEAEKRDPVPWGEHKKATDEAARYRTQLRGYEEAFGGWAPEDAQVLLKAVGAASQLLANGEGAKARQMFTLIAEKFGDDVAEQVAEQADAASTDDNGDLLTRAEVEKMLAERDENASQEQAVSKEAQRISAMAPTLGYDLATDEGTDGWARVLAEAMNFHDYDIEAAHKALLERDEQAVQRYLDGKKEGAELTPRPAGGQAPQPAAQEAPKSIKDASDDLRRFLDSAT